MVAKKEKAFWETRTFWMNVIIVLFVLATGSVDQLEAADLPDEVDAVIISLANIVKMFFRSGATVVLMKSK
jgi:hypothetical protein